jgi:peptidyl-dipeptidase Dcp
VDELLRRPVRLTGFLPVIANHLNIPKPPAGQPTLLTWDETTTMFHEFGHALHGMFSNVKYPYFSGTAVPRDFVEYPSQVNEMWADWPQVLQHYAKHYQTGAPMPQALLDKVIASKKFNQGFTTTEYLGASMLDQNWHQLTGTQVPDAASVMPFEAAALKKTASTSSRCRRVIARRTSATSWAAMQRATTPTSGRKCWTRTASNGSGRTGD